MTATCQQICGSDVSEHEGNFISVSCLGSVCLLLGKVPSSDTYLIYPQHHIITVYLLNITTVSVFVYHQCSRETGTRRSSC